MVENWISGNTDLHYGKGGDLTGPDREHAEVSMLALHLLQSALVHVFSELAVCALGRRRRPARWLARYCAASARFIISWTIVILASA